MVLLGQVDCEDFGRRVLRRPGIARNGAELSYDGNEE
jgi:hypothetical protein